MSIFGKDTSDDGHEHKYSKEIEFSWMTGTPHRKCEIEGCRFISLDLTDEEDLCDV